MWRGGGDGDGVGKFRGGTESIGGVRDSADHSPRVRFDEITPPPFATVPPMPIDRTLTLELLQALVRIDSRNPGLEDGAPGEREIAGFVAEQLTAWGWPAEVHDLGTSRANVVARRRGAAGGLSLMINAHLDTVGTSGMDDPFSGAFRDGCVHGRGAQDTKGGVAAALAMAHAIAHDDTALDGDLVLAFVADEEHESIGTADVVRRVRTDAAIVLEPSDLDVVVGHRGFGVFRLVVRGRRAHGGRPDLGVDANRHMAHVLVALDRLEADWRTAHVHPALGAASLHVPRVEGGRHTFVYADECVAEVECRILPGMSPHDVTDALRGALARVRDGGIALDATLEDVMWRAAHEIDADRPIVRALTGAVSQVRGTPARTTYHPWWEDSALLAEAGIDAVVIGPRGGGLHTAEEWVELDSVVDLAEILQRAVGRYGLERGASPSPDPHHDPAEEDTNHG